MGTSENISSEQALQSGGFYHAYWLQVHPQEPRDDWHCRATQLKPQLWAQVNLISSSSAVDKKGSVEAAWFGSSMGSRFVPALALCFCFSVLFHLLAFVIQKKG